MGNPARSIAPLFFMRLFFLRSIGSVIAAQHAMLLSALSSALQHAVAVSSNCWSFMRRPIRCHVAPVQKGAFWICALSLKGSTVNLCHCGLLHVLSHGFGVQTVATIDRIRALSKGTAWVLLVYALLSSTVTMGTVLVKHQLPALVVALGFASVDFLLSHFQRKYFVAPKSVIPFWTPSKLP